VLQQFLLGPSDRQAAEAVLAFLAMGDWSRSREESRWTAGGQLRVTLHQGLLLTLADVWIPVVEILLKSAVSTS
jgi:hypothetical protein